MEVDGYRVEDVVDRGGIGIVYRAVELASGTRVALKVLDPALADDDELRVRFRTEARAAAAVQHPNVIPIHGFADAWLAMRYVEGTDLRRLAPLPAERGARIVAQAAAALDAVHAAGLVHRDVKPGNLLVEEPDDRVFLTDFGLARRAADPDPGLTHAGNWLGTVDFAAPEQIRGHAAGPPADIYGLGGVLYWALTAEVPYPREDDDAKMRAHLDDPPPSLGGALSAFDAVVARAMAKEPEARYASAGDLGTAALAASSAARENT